MQMRPGGTASILPLYVTWGGNNVVASLDTFVVGASPLHFVQNQHLHVSVAPSANQVSSVNQAHL